MPIKLMLITNFGLASHTAKDGEAALHLFKTNWNRTCCDTKYRLVITDLDLPVMDGLQLSIKLKEFVADFNDTHSKSMKLPVLALTQSVTPETRK
mmetsp:Transcript_25505/g.34739  ORF Transcript_25505/g.34739 Transcript_25505/m.34739 type:complete len:95 (+) Transcript_25505:461-745(+)